MSSGFWTLEVGSIVAFTVSCSSQQQKLSAMNTWVDDIALSSTEFTQLVSL